MLKNIIAVFTLALFILISNVAFGHSSGHGKPPSNEQILAKASQDLAIIVDKSEPVEGKVLGTSWKGATTKAIYNKTFKHYVVSFTHAEEKRTLYILLNNQGTYLGANFEGKFKEL
jgi:hypothetical protein